MSEINVYCDESCHLENDGISVMSLGSIYCNKENTKIFSKRFNQLKMEFGFPSYLEVKWNKISPSNKKLYMDLITVFFECEGLFFRGYVAANKDNLDHKRFMQDYNTWYYKMYYRMLQGVINEKNLYNIYIDMKDTIGGVKVNELGKILNRTYSSTTPINKIQIVDSKESTLLQIADIFAGALSFSNRKDIIQKGVKKEICDYIEKRSGFHLTKSTPLSEMKTNWFHWSGR